MTLQELASKVADFDSWSQTEKIKFFGWFMHVHRGHRRFSTAMLRACYDELHIGDPESFSPFFKSLEERKPRELLRDASGCYLERRVIDDFTRRFGGSSATAPISDMLAALPARISDSAERGFIEEALTCIRAGAPRAAIVLGWCAVIDRMRRKVEAVGFDKFNAASAKMKASSGKYKWWNKGVQANSPTELQAVFDSDLIIVFVGLELLDPNEARRLDTLFGWRCDSAHPSAAPIGPSHVITFFTDIVELVLGNPKFEV